jgi:hypothetical protein
MLNINANNPSLAIVHPNILPPHIPIHTPHTYIAIRHLTRRRNAGMRHLRHQHFLVALHPVCIRRTHHDLFRAHMHMYRRVRHA